MIPQLPDEVWGFILELRSDMMYKEAQSYFERRHWEEERRFLEEGEMQEMWSLNLYEWLG